MLLRLKKKKHSNNDADDKYPELKNASRLFGIDKSIAKLLFELIGFVNSLNNLITGYTPSPVSLT